MDTSDVWHEHREALFTFIKRRVTSEFDAEDILQDVFGKIHSSLPRLADDLKLRSWMYHIARNTITDYYRTAATRKKAELPLAADFDMPEQPGDRTDLNELVSGWLKCFVQRLEAKYRDALLLTEFEQITQKELAGRLGISVSGAKSRVQRGRAKVKELLLQCCRIEMDRLGNVIDVQSRTRDCSCAGCHNSFA